MKLFRRLLIALVSVNLILAAVKTAIEVEAPVSEAIPQKETTPAEAKSIKEFQVQMTEVKANFATHREASRDSEVCAHQLPCRLGALLTKVKTDDLPVDMADSFSNFKSSVQQNVELLVGMPEDEALAMDWAATKFGDPKFAAAMEAGSESQFEAGSKFRELGTQYGLGAEIDLYDFNEVLELPEDR